MEDHRTSSRADRHLDPISGALPPLRLRPKEQADPSSIQQTTNLGHRCIWIAKQQRWAAAYHRHHGAGSAPGQSQLDTHIPRADDDNARRTLEESRPVIEDMLAKTEALKRTCAPVEESSVLSEQPSDHRRKGRGITKGMRRLEGAQIGPSGRVLGENSQQRAQVLVERRISKHPTEDAVPTATKARELAELTEAPNASAGTQLYRERRRWRRSIEGLVQGTQQPGALPDGERQRDDGVVGMQRCGGGVMIDAGSCLGRSPSPGGRLRQGQPTGTHAPSRSGTPAAARWCPPHTSRPSRRQRRG